MGTRSNTVVYYEWINGNNQREEVQVLNLYRQMDGYIEGHGVDLLKFLEPMTIVNGFTMGLTNIANGAGCLAAQLVAHFKDGVGGFYIQTPMGDENENDYTYKIYVAESSNNISVSVYDWDDQIFSGSVPEFKKFVGEQL
jgi:hypothetical protein